MQSYRYTRVEDYDSAVQLLYLGGELLLENGLGASGADITISLIEVYNTAHLKPDSTNRGEFPFSIINIYLAMLMWVSSYYAIGWNG